jgi:hypothetical protein
MSQGSVFKGVYPIGDADTNALPVKAIGPAVGYYMRDRPLGGRGGPWGRRRPALPGRTTAQVTCQSRRQAR